MNTRAELRGRPLMALRPGAIVVAIASGFYALAAFSSVRRLNSVRDWHRAVHVGSPQTSSNGRMSANVGRAEGLPRLRCLTLAPVRRIRCVVLVRASIFRARWARISAFLHRSASESAWGNRAMRPSWIKTVDSYSLLTREGPQNDGLIHLIKTES